jgi:hypothetical protein
MDPQEHLGSEWRGLQDESGLFASGAYLFDRLDRAGSVGLINQFTPRQPRHGMTHDRTQERAMLFWREAHRLDILHHGYEHAYLVAINVFQDVERLPVERRLDQPVEHVVRMRGLT